MIVNEAGIHKMIVIVANRIYRDETAASDQSDLDLRCLSILFWLANIVRILQHFYICVKRKVKTIYCLRDICVIYFMHSHETTKTQTDFVFDFRGHSERQHSPQLRLTITFRIFI